MLVHWETGYFGDLRVTGKFYVYLREIPDNRKVSRTMKPIIYLGFLTEQVFETKDRSQELSKAKTRRKRLQIQNQIVNESANLPTMQFTSETVEMTAWLLSEISNELDQKRKKIIGKYVDEISLNQPGTGSKHTHVDMFDFSTLELTNSCHHQMSRTFVNYGGKKSVAYECEKCGKVKIL